MVESIFCAGIVRYVVRRVVTSGRARLSDRPTRGEVIFARRVFGLKEVIPEDPARAIPALGIRWRRMVLMRNYIPS